MIFPIGTDAPVYYWPYGTVGLIIANLLVFFAGAFGALPVESLQLDWGQGLHPVQWVTSSFMHGGLFHLIGNMLVLWVFGLVVEGKLGAPRFIACYMGIAVGESALEQLLMLGYSGDPTGSLGASTAIYGLMAIATVWAPRNNITFFYWLFIVFSGTFDIPVAIVCVIYFGFDLLDILFAGGGPATGWLHMAGLLFGFPLGVVMLRTGVIDCEGWDLFHVWRGDPGAEKQKEQEHQQRMELRAEKRRRREEETLTAARQQLHKYLAAGNGPAALKLLEKMSEVGEGLELDEKELAHLVKGLHATGRWRESAPHMARLIERRDGREADLLRLKLAQICVVELGRPGRALELLDQVDAPALPAQRQRLCAKVRARAEQLRDEGEVELDDDAW